MNIPGVIYCVPVWTRLIFRCIRKVAQSDY